MKKTIAGARIFVGTLVEKAGRRISEFGRRVLGDAPGHVTHVFYDSKESMTELEDFFDFIRADVRSGVPAVDAIAKRIKREGPIFIGIDYAIDKDESAATFFEDGKVVATATGPRAAVELSEKAQQMLVDGAAPFPRPKRDEQPVIVTKRVR